ncbi:MAG: hypothetical protein AAGH89_19230, partial [Verrucomicrobiota bacterium]
EIKIKDELGIVDFQAVTMPGPDWSLDPEVAMKSQQAIDEEERKLCDWLTEHYPDWDTDPTAHWDEKPSGE